MNDVEWGQTRTLAAWHIVGEADWRGLRKSLCGRRLEPLTIRNDRPGNEKTCESCYRIGGPR